MAKSTIPVYDICTIEQKSAHNDLLIERFAGYLEKHYHSLHRPHRHSFYHLVLFTKGGGTHSIDFERFPVKPYQMYFMAPGQVHSWHFEGGVDGYIVHFNELLFTSFLQNGQYLERFDFFAGKTEDCVCQLPIAVHDLVVNLFESMLHEVAQTTGHYLDMIRMRLMELFITIDRSCTSTKGKNIPQQKRLLLRNYQQLIENHFRNLKLPKEYADLLYVTPNHLNALCQDLLGKTAGDLIRGRVLLEGKRLLTHANMSITEVAYDLNFQDNSYFNRFFKKETGMTPDEFRKQYIN